MKSRMTQAEREEMTKWNRAQARGYHEARRWRNVPHLSEQLDAARSMIRRK